MRLASAKFEEWVVRMQLTPEIRDRPRAEAESLADLVDFAIDSDTGVVEDPNTGELAVVADEFLAVDDPPATLGPPESESPVADSGLFEDRGLSQDTERTGADNGEKDDEEIVDSGDDSTLDADQSVEE